MFKIALNAGHYLANPKGIPSYLGLGNIREWTLNARIAEKVTALLKEYTGYELLRIDDPTGKTDVSLEARTDAANAFAADLYLSIHHNAGINGADGGGIVAIVHPAAGEAARRWQGALYDALVEATGLKGNRSQPLTQMDLHEVRETAMAAVLLELGFMDSRVDAPIIVTEEFADQCAGAIVKVLAQLGELEKRPVQDRIYRVQVGAFRDKGNAEAYLARVRAAGFPEAFLTE